jgi:outer membrane protein OmpA-like peptidoglycan-associated protein
MSQTQRFFNLTAIIVIVCITTLFVVSAVAQKKSESVGGDNVKTVLFRDANTAMKTAEDANADILAPKNFGEAMQKYKEAENELQNGNDLDDIRQNLREACNFFKKATDATRLAAVTFPNLMKARTDARNTGARKFSSNLWTEAEKKFNDAAVELEDGDVNDAREEAAEAEKLYRQAELDAIKANYLDETRELLKQADEKDVEDYAPKTLQLSQQLVKQAEKELNENRYDTDVARGLARQANYEVKHAIYLASVIKQMQEKDHSWEDLMLASEKPLQQIAEKTYVVPTFENGPGKTTTEIITYVSVCQNNIVGLSQDLAWNQQENNLKEARITELEQQLGSQAQEKSSLAQQIADQAKSRQQFTDVERSFAPEDALVLREGNDIILRLVGLNFPSAASTIEQKSFGLLTKVRDAIRSYPGSSVSVLGYTDSYGGDVQNLELSTARAEAVKQYLLANTDLNDSRIIIVGYGESKPIASNETIKGRATNRRVEVVIHPKQIEKQFGFNISK